MNILIKIKWKRNHVWCALGLVFLFSCAAINRAHQHKQNSTHQIVAQKGVVTDTTKPLTDTAKKNGLKPYDKVITAKAITDSGLFIVHQLGDRYYLEIPDSMLGQEILIVSRLAEATIGYRGDGVVGAGAGMSNYAGDEVGDHIIKFTKGPNHKIFLRAVYDWMERSADGSDNGMLRSLSRSSVNPVVAAFEIKAYNKDSSAVIDVTDYFKGDFSLLFRRGSGLTMGRYGLSIEGFEADMSYIREIKSFPHNVELITVKTYKKKDWLAQRENMSTSTYVFNTSMVLLPQQVMKPRMWDDRIGYFSQEYADFDEPVGVQSKSMITRWRLEPKEEDVERYFKGELVEPKKPIVYYIDPATPKKWVPYLIQAVNDWQKAFEKAGFKNAIYALEAPVNDSTWSLYDALHNAIVYKPSIIQNANGPHVRDPRSGEILESHINWYHSIQELLRDWYMVQAGPSDPRARKLVFDDELMGQLIRYVCAHEVGHTLGLQHNFGASSTIPVDSLRDKNYVKANGHCPSIMDYARFNYVAQPEDSVDITDLIPRIGVYDEWAIEWGYRWFPKDRFATTDTEAAFMREWISDKLKKDKRLWYGTQRGPFVSDPRSVGEDVGDDPIKAGEYGIKNLKYVMKNIVDWSANNEGNYEDLKKLYNRVVNQYNFYLTNSFYYLYGNYYRNSYQGVSRADNGKCIDFIAANKRKESLIFLNKHLFQIPEWLLDSAVHRYLGISPDNLIYQLHRNYINGIFSPYSTVELITNEFYEPEQADIYDKILVDLESYLWEELKTGKKIDPARRSLQKVYAEALMDQIMVSYSSDGRNRIFFYWLLREDGKDIIYEHVRSLIRNISRALPRFNDKESRLHLEYVKDRLKKALSGRVPLNKYPYWLASVTGRSQTGEDLKIDKHEVMMPPFLMYHSNLNCWNTLLVDWVEMPQMNSKLSY